MIGLPYAGLAGLAPGAGPIPDVGFYGTSAALGARRGTGGHTAVAAPVNE